MDPIATTEDYQKYVGAPPAGIQDELLAISADVRRRCGWHITPVVQETIQLDGTGGEEIILPTLHVVSITSVTENGVVIAGDQLEWSTDGYLRKSGGGCWTYKLNGIELIWSHGYAADEVPDLKRMICEVAARVSSSPVGVASESVGGVAVQYSGRELLLSDQELINFYKV